MIKVLMIVVTFISSVVLFSALFFSLVYLGAFGSLPGKDELAAIRQEEASLVFSSDGTVIGEFFAKNRTSIHPEDIPAHLKHALTATEDKRFFTRSGYDIRSLARVFLKSILLGKKSGGGGSTLSQQLVKNLYGRNDYGFISLPVNKIREIIIGARIEQVYSKDELLLLYLNTVPFGEDVYGVESAARRYFNKHTRELTIQESAVLVGLLKANTHFNPRLNPENSISRRNMVLNLMAKEHYLSAKACDSLQKLPVELNYENIGLTPPAGYFVYQVKKKASALLDSVKAKTGKAYNLEKDGLKIYTTLDMSLQELVMEAARDHLSVMQKMLDKELEVYKVKTRWYNNQRNNNADLESESQLREIGVFDWDGFRVKKMNTLDSIWHYYKMLNAAVLLTNPENGEVLAWTGGNNFATLPFDMVLSHRQIASAFKPFVYATALESGFTPCVFLSNKIKKYPGYEDWEPQNYDHSSTPDSTVALWYALVNSINLPTVDLYFKEGRENLLKTCNKLEFPVITGDAPSVALGTLDLSLYEIVRAYASFANKGQMNEPVMIDKILDARGNTLYSREPLKPKRVFTPETSQVITAILQEVINQGRGVRIRSDYGVKASVAGKTGTAQNYSDAWFIAYTPGLVLGTWVGARSADVHFFSSNGSGVSLALPVVGKILEGIEKDPQLHKKYLTPFKIPAETYSFLNCDAYRQKGIQGFFNRLFKGTRKKAANNIDHEAGQTGH
ncbi:MAG: transglycosylase domain-containing protein [Bacteroidota bacterium]